MNELVEKKCVVCESIYFVNTRPKKQTKTITIRKPADQTCSKPCAKIYIRIYRKIHQNLRKKVYKELMNIPKIK